MRNAGREDRRALMAELDEAYDERDRLASAPAEKTVKRLLTGETYAQVWDRSTDAEREDLILEVGRFVVFTARIFPLTRRCNGNRRAGPLAWASRNCRQCFTFVARLPRNSPWSPACRLKGPRRAGRVPFACQHQELRSIEPVKGPRKSPEGQDKATSTPGRAPRRSEGHNGPLRGMPWLWGLVRHPRA